jgi:yecA family protein
MFDFDVLEKMLEDVNAGRRAAECHGFICAQICIAGNITEHMLTENLLGDAAEDMLISECQTQISELVIDVSEQLASPEIELQLILPDDEMSLEIRGIALTEWCQGFLSGLEVAGLDSTEAMSDASKELIDDLYKISRLNTEDLDEYVEQNEHDLMELIEYVRMGAILIYDEFHDLLSNKDLPETLH